MFRLHETAIVRPHVLENVKKKLCSYDCKMYDRDLALT